MMNDDDYNEIRELVDDYEKSLANGIEPYLDVDDTIDIAQYYDDRGQTDNVRRVLEHGLKLHPGEPEIVSFLVRITIVAYGDIAKAERYAAMITRHDNIDAVLVKSDILIAKEKYEEADALIQKSIERFDSEQQTDLLVEVAQMYMFADNAQNALTWLRKCPTKTSRDYLELLGEALTALTQYEESEQVYNQLLDIDPFAVDYWNDLTASQMAQHKVEAARESINYCLAIDPHNYQARINEAQTYFFSGDTKQARKLMWAVLKEYRALPKEEQDLEFACALTLHYCKILLVNDDPYKAIELLTELKVNPATFELRTYDIVKQLAIAYVTLDRHERALKIVREMLSDPFDGNYCKYRVLEGSLLLDTGDYAAASDSFLEAIRRAEATSETVFEIGVAYYDCGYYRNALEMLQSVNDNSNDDIGLGYIAACYNKLGEHKSYLQALKRACEVCPQEVEEVFNIEIPLNVSPANYFNYVISHDDKPESRSRRKKDE